MFTPSLSRWLTAAAPALIAALALLARLLPGARTIDDAFITFRYARNLLAGQGFVFNAGEAVLGTTTPLYTLLMAGLGALTGGSQAPFALLAMGVNALADAAVCLLLWWLARRLGFERAGLAAALAWAVAPFSVTFAVGGLETSLYVALLTGCVASAAAANWQPRGVIRARLRAATALLASLALLTRPDALILLGPLALERLWAAWKGKEVLRWDELAAAVLPYGAWAIYAAFFFGSPLPHSVLAKALAYRLEAGEALVRLVQHYATPFLEQNWLGAAAAVGLGLLLYPLLTLLGLRRLRRSGRAVPAAVWLWALYPWLYLVTFAAANPLIFRWYLTPPLAAYCFFIFIGLDGLLAAARAALARRGQSWGAALTALLLLPALLSLGEWRLYPDHGPRAPAPAMAYIQLERLYRQAAQHIAPQLTPDSVLAAGDVGVLGYDTPARILDTVGLNSPVSSRYYPLPAPFYVINYAIPTDLLLDQRPDWVVTLEVYGRRTFLADARFAAAYRLEQKIATDMYGSDGLLIFHAR